MPLRAERSTGWRQLDLRYPTTGRHASGPRRAVFAWPRRSARWRSSFDQGPSGTTPSSTVSSTASDRLSPGMDATSEACSSRRILNSVQTLARWSLCQQPETAGIGRARRRAPPAPASLAAPASRRGVADQLAGHQSRTGRAKSLQRDGRRGCRPGQRHGFATGSAPIGSLSSFYLTVISPSRTPANPLGQVLAARNAPPSPGLLGGTYQPDAVSSSGLAVTSSIDTSSTGGACKLDGAVPGQVDHRRDPTQAGCTW